MADKKKTAQEWISYLRVQANDMLLTTFKLPIFNTKSLEQISNLDEVMIKTVEHLRNTSDEENFLKSHLTKILNEESHPLGKIFLDFIIYWSKTYVPQDDNTSLASKAIEQENQSVVFTHSLDQPDILKQFERRSLQDNTNSNADLPETKAFKRSTTLINTFQDSLIEAVCRYYQMLLMEKHSRFKIFKKTIECVLFNTLLQFKLFELYKLIYKTNDENCSKFLLSFVTISPAHLGISERFWLLNNSSMPQSRPTNARKRSSSLRRQGSKGSLYSSPIELKCKEEPIKIQDPPYHRSIGLLRSLSKDKTPSDKVDKLVQVQKSIYSCVKNFYASQDQDIVVGGDELIPLMTYVLIKSNLQSAYSESRFIEDFMDTDDEFGERGYSAVTFQTSLAVVSSLEKTQLELCAEKQLKSVIDNLPPEHLSLVAQFPSSLLYPETKEDTSLANNIINPTIGAGSLSSPPSGWMPLDRPLSEGSLSLVVNAAASFNSMNGIMNPLASSIKMPVPMMPPDEVPRGRRREPTSSIHCPSSQLGGSPDPISLSFSMSSTRLDNRRSLSSKDFYSSSTYQSAPSTPLAPVASIIPSSSSLKTPMVVLRFLKEPKPPAPSEKDVLYYLL
eukprot:TRINITY_DN1459_c0_g1_i1.p1 TRINITY_DN1459_c0_g1~~TRINITY_DN1459_c0_g1_i1.p1  ORF type:complete len:617 (-),score=98.56 TRINITY_DN1459_c0_g1_i1:148-1998(-)